MTDVAQLRPLRARRLFSRYLGAIAACELVAALERMSNSLERFAACTRAGLDQERVQGWLVELGYADAPSKCARGPCPRPVRATARVAVRDGRTYCSVACCQAEASEVRT